MEANMKQLLSDVISKELEISMMYSDFMAVMQDISLQGFKRYYRCRMKDRVKHCTMLRNYVSDYHDVCLPISVSSYAPGAAWATTGIIARVQKVITDDATTSNEQIVRLEKISDLAITQEEHDLMGYIEDLIKDQSCELKCLRRIINSWKFSQQAGDSSWYDRTSKCLHKKYKKREGDYDR